MEKTQTANNAEKEERERGTGGGLLYMERGTKEKRGEKQMNGSIYGRGDGTKRNQRRARNSMHPLSLSLSYEGPSRSLTWIGVRCFCAGFRAASAFAFRERCLSLSLLNHMFPDSPSPIHDVLDD